MDAAPETPAEENRRALSDPILRTYTASDAARATRERREQVGERVLSVHLRRALKVIDKEARAGRGEVHARETIFKEEEWVEIRAFADVFRAALRTRGFFTETCARVGGDERGFYSEIAEEIRIWWRGT